MLPVIAGVAVAFMIAGGAAMFYVLSQLVMQQEETDYETIEVQNFLGKLYESDEQILSGMENADLYKLVIESVYDADTPENTVIAQEPAEGEKRKVSRQNEQLCEVLLTVSRGAETFQLQDLTNQEFRQVELLLSRMGLKFDIKEEYHDTALSGYVFGMEPEPGATVTSGDTITLYVSKGQEIVYVDVPNFLGLTKEEAMKALIEKGLALGKVTYVKSDMTPGIILTQSQPEFASVPKSATKIDFTVSGGPNYDPEAEKAEETETEEVKDGDAAGENA